jgi:hypothetical protein
VYNTEQIYQLENVEHFMFWGRDVRNNANCVPKTKRSIAIIKHAEEFLHQKIGLKCTEEANKVLCYMCSSTALYGAETCTLRIAEF